MITLKRNYKKILNTLIFCYSFAPILVSAFTISSIIPDSPDDITYRPLALNVDPSNMAGFINRLFEVSLILGAILAVIMIAIGGLEYMTTDSTNEKTSSKTRIRQALIGLLMLLAIQIFYNEINPKILNIDFKLKPVSVTGDDIKPLTRAEKKSAYIGKLTHEGKLRGEEGDSVRIKIIKAEKGVPIDISSCGGPLPGYTLEIARKSSASYETARYCGGFDSWKQACCIYKK